ncbi:hypothetical protein [Pontibacillus sp. HMF3514]|uniref:hypothetical protein n=1 Tax=Pontibacillus sp. HMF3514 TaxID=2692425 RepID=UPI0013201E4D|nr:hypothetical protein [Pontibacillus sp. HMF3514]QHE52832.1 hypothetical protein GS400_12725 [Pontibacillus sp. HMF3514]
MKRFMIGLCFALLVSFAIISATDSLAKDNKDERGHSFTVPSNQEEKEIKDKVDKANKKFMKDVKDDIVATHNINLQGYKEKDLHEVYNSEGDLNKIAPALGEIMKKQERGDVKPILYVKNNKAVILEKKNDGTNHVYTLKLKNDAWEIDNKKHLKGKKIKHPLNKN